MKRIFLSLCVLLLCASAAQAQFGDFKAMLLEAGTVVQTSGVVRDTITVPRSVEDYNVYYQIDFTNNSGTSTGSVILDESRGGKFFPIDTVAYSGTSTVLLDHIPKGYLSRVRIVTSANQNTSFRALVVLRKKE